MSHPGPEASPKTNQRQQQRATTRQLILESAGRVFGQAGFEAASMADIAARAGLKKALVQYHFETKEKLWKAAVAQLWRQRDEMLPTYFEPTYLEHSTPANGVTALRAIFTALLTFTRNHPEWITLILRESSRPGPRLNWLIENYLQDDIARGSAFIAQAQANHLLPDVSPLQLLHLISGALSYNLLVAPMTRQATGVDLSSQESIEEQVAILMLMLGAHSA